jgi:hypothetical protein
MARNRLDMNQLINLLPQSSGLDLISAKRPKISGVALHSALY